MEIANENDLFSQQVTLEPYRSRLEEQYRAWAKEHSVKVNKEKVDFTKPAVPVIRFLHEVQQNFYKEMIKYLRSVGVKIPITGSNWSRSLALLSALSATDYTDSHCYWGWGSNRPMLEKKDIFATLSFNRLLNRPFFVSEWDEPWPNEWRAESPLLIAAVAAFQGWNGATIHTYRYRYSGPMDHMGGVVMGGGRHRVIFEAPFNDPAKFGLFYHAALLFRRRHVESAQKTIGIQIPEEIIFKPPKSGRTEMPALTITPEKHKVGMVLPGQTTHADIMTSPDDTAISDQFENEVVSDTGQLYRNWAKRIGWIDTPRTKAAYGFVGEVEEISMNGLKLKVKTPFAAIAISSLTNEPINGSSNLLLTAVGKADNTGAKYNADHTYPLEIGHGPILIEPVEAMIELTTAQSHLRVWSINPEGLYTGTIATEYTEGTLKFEVGKTFPSMYYLIHR